MCEQVGFEEAFAEVEQVPRSFKPKEEKKKKEKRRKSNPRVLFFCKIRFVMVLV